MRTLAAFAKVFIADGSLVRLHPNLQDGYPSVWTNHTTAAAKLHVTIDGASRTPEILRIVPGSKHDVTLLDVGPWCKNALLVFGLAYYQGKRFRQILDHGGSFLCRVKKDANSVILAAKKSRWVGLKHKDVLSEMHGKTFEAEVDCVYRHVPEREWPKRHLRLIAVWRHDIAVSRTKVPIQARRHANRQQGCNRVSTLCGTAHDGDRTQTSPRTPSATSLHE